MPSKSRALIPSRFDNVLLIKLPSERVNPKVAGSQKDFGHHNPQHTKNKSPMSGSNCLATLAMDPKTASKTTSENDDVALRAVAYSFDVQWGGKESSLWYGSAPVTNFVYIDFKNPSTKTNTTMTYQEYTQAFLQRLLLTS